MTWDWQLIFWMWSFTLLTFASIQSTNKWRIIDHLWLGVNSLLHRRPTISDFLTRYSGNISRRWRDARRTYGNGQLGDKNWTSSVWGRDVLITFFQVGHKQRVAQSEEATSIVKFVGKLNMLLIILTTNPIKTWAEHAWAVKVAELNSLNCYFRSLPSGLHHQERL